MIPLARVRRWMTPLHALLLAALLLGAQGLGLAHRVAHAATAETGHAAEHLAAHGASEWVDGHHEGGAECRLVDQLGHADLAFGLCAPPAACAAGSTAPAEPAQAAPRAAPAALYLARGPPQHPGPAA